MGQVESDFDKFSLHVQGFQKTLYTLVASSFLFSAISSIVQYENVVKDPALAAMTTLFGTIGGSAGVLVTYVGWAAHPKDVFVQTLRFEAHDYRSGIAIRFFLSAICLYAYFAFARRGFDLSLIFILLGAFFFFSALVTSALVAAQVENLNRTWKNLDSEQKSQWIRAENEEKARLEALKRNAKRHMAETAKLIKDADRVIRESRRLSRKHRWESFWEPVKRFLSFLYRLFLGIRIRLGRDKLLTASERFDWRSRNIEVDRMLDEAMSQALSEIHSKMESGEIIPVRLEQSNFTFIREGDRVLTEIPGDLTSDGASEICNNLRTAAEQLGVSNPSYTVYIPEHANVSAESLNVMRVGKVEVVRVGRWTPL